MSDERLSFYDSPVFSPNEINAIKRFHNLLEATYKKVPDTYRPEELKDNKEWNDLRVAAKEELQIFAVRGLFDEENEII